MRIRHSHSACSRFCFAAEICERDQTCKKMVTAAHQSNTPRVKNHIWCYRGKGAAEQQPDNEGFEQREHNRDAAGAGLEQKAKQQRLLLEQARADPSTKASCVVKIQVDVDCQAIVCSTVLKQPAWS